MARLASDFHVPMGRNLGNRGPSKQQKYDQKPTHSRHPLWHGTIHIGQRAV